MVERTAQNPTSAAPQPRLTVELVPSAELVPFNEATICLCLPGGAEYIEQPYEFRELAVLWPRSSGGHDLASVDAPIEL
jgi:hypothetical protein